MKKLSGIMILLGLLGMPYWIYCTQFSGSKLDSVNIIRGISTGGLTTTQGKTPGAKLGPVRISPDMNPVGLSLDTHYKHLGAPLSSIHYDLSLINSNEEQIWETQSRVSLKREDSDKSSQKALSQSLGNIKIQNPDSYFFVVNLKPGTGIKFINATISLRRNVKEADKRILILCGILFLGGFIGATASKKRTAS